MYRTTPWHKAQPHPTCYHYRGTELTVNTFHFPLLDRLRDLLLLLQEITTHEHNLVPLFLGQKVHHAVRRRSTTHGIDPLPALRRVQEGTHGVEARNAIGAGDDGCEVLDLGREGWQGVVDC